MDLFVLRHIAFFLTRNRDLKLEHSSPYPKEVILNQWYVCHWWYAEGRLVVRKIIWEL